MCIREECFLGGRTEQAQGWHAITVRKIVFGVCLQGWGQELPLTIHMTLVLLPKCLFPELKEKM